jgi:hypothetical protein
LEELKEKTGAYTGEEDQHFDLACQKSASKVECLGVSLAGERHFPDGRGDEWFAALCSNEPLNLKRAPTL